MPYMLNDFLVLYHTKMKLIKEYPMPQDAKYFTNVELMNVIFSWLKMCKKQGNYSEKLLREDVIFQKYQMLQYVYAREKSLII